MKGAKQWWIDLVKPHPAYLRLFSRFAAASLVGFIVITFLLLQLWTSKFESHLVNEARETKSRYIRALVGHLLTEEDFREVKKGADWEAFRKKIADLYSLPEVVRIKIYNQGGDLIWSDSAGLLELSLPAKTNPELMKALEGRVEANVSRLHKKENLYERGTFSTLMELYIPIYLGQRKKPLGVAEVYLNVNPLFARIRNMWWLIGLTLTGGLGLLLFISFIGLARAVAVIHRQNQDLRGALEEMFKVHRLKDELVANLSHEIRNPEAIMSYTGLLLDGAFGDLPERVRPSLEKMRNTSAEILSHFTRILELVRLKIRDVHPQREPVNLTELLHDITNDLRLLCGNGSVSLKCEVPDDAVIINSDRDLVHRVIFGLVTNALKFTPKGYVYLRVEKDPDRGGAKVLVEDTGVGIKPEDLPKIFDEFYRGNDHRARFKSGVGLGLAIVKRSLDILQGEIQVESVYDKGSKFSVIFPNL